MKVVIVDDHPVVRKGIEDMLRLEKDMEILKSASTYQAGLGTIKDNDPDMAIIDLKLAEENGIDLIVEAKKHTQNCQFMILSSYSNAQEVSRAISCGIYGYVLKDALPEELLEAIRLVAKGRKYYDPEIIDMVINNGNESSPFGELTERETDILKALAEGLSNRAIAEKLVVSENTVKKHICNILEKLELQDRTQAALLAYSHGLGGKETKNHAWC